MAGERTEGIHICGGHIPVAATGLNHLRGHGPAGPVFLRSGRDPEPLREPLVDPRREAAQARAREAANRLGGGAPGAGHDRPGPRSDRRCAACFGDPLDGPLPGITGWTQDEVRPVRAPSAGCVARWRC